MAADEKLARQRLSVLQSAETLDNVGEACRRRVNYDRLLTTLCDLVMAPFASWSSDRNPGVESATETRSD